MSFILALGAGALAAMLAGASAQAEAVVVMRVIDGDTIIIGEPCSKFLPGRMLRIRVRGIDTPESRKPPARCDAEVEAGKAATAFARSLVRPGDEITVSNFGADKYMCRVVASVTLPDGRDMATELIAAGHARPYGESGVKKQSWCPTPRKKRSP
jgi:endonuclease YncB( thermonuclease family)